MTRHQLTAAAAWLVLSLVVGGAVARLARPARKHTDTRSLFV